MIDVTPILDIVICMKLLFYPQQKLRVKSIEIESLTMPRTELSPEGYYAISYVMMNSDNTYFPYHDHALTFCYTETCFNTKCLGIIC